jgi:hypothetical protein
VVLELSAVLACNSMGYRQMLMVSLSRGCWLRKDSLFHALPSVTLFPCRVPYLRAPFFAWVGRPWADARFNIHHEQKVERPALFPPTFLYTQSWEDPEPDMKV